MTRKHHKIELKDFQEWLTEEEAVFASSQRERKRLVCKLNGSMIVYKGNEVVWQGIQPFSAVEAYNAIAEKYVDETKDFII